MPAATTIRQRNIEWNLILRDQVTAGLQGMQRTIGGMSAGFAGLAAALSPAISLASEFARSMGEVATLIPGQADRVAELGEAVQELATSTGVSSDLLSRGLYQTISAFGDSADTVDRLRLAALAARAGVSDVASAVSLASAATKAYGDTSAVAVEHALDLALMTVRLGETSFPALAAAMPRVTAIASELGVTMEEVNAVFAATTGVAGSTSEVASGLRGTLVALMKPSSELSDAFGRMGVESGRALIEAEGLQGAIAAVYQESVRSGQELSEYIGSVESLPIAMALATAQADDYQTKLEQLADAHGTVTVAVEAMDDGVAGSVQAWERWKQAGRGAAQDVGAALLSLPGPLGTVAAGLGDIVGTGAQMAAQLIPQLILVATQLGLIDKISKVLSVSARGMWRAMLGPIGAITAALGVLTTAVVYLYDKWKDNAEQAQAEQERINAQYIAGVQRTLDADRAWRDESLKNIKELNAAKKESIITSDEWARMSAEQRRAWNAGVSVEELAQLDALKKKQQEVAAAFDAHLMVSQKRLFQSMKRGINAATRGLGTIKLHVAELVNTIDSKPLAEVDILGINRGIKRNMVLAKRHASKTAKQLTDEVEEQIGAWSRGGGWSNLFDGFTASVSAFSTGGLKGGLASILHTATDFLPPGLSQVAKAGIAAFTAVWKAWKRPTEAEIAARKSFAGLHEAAKDELSKLPEYQESVQKHIADGWDRTLAETLSAFSYWGQQAGLTHDQAVAHYARYQQAVKDGNEQVIQSIEATYKSWQEQGRATMEAAEAQSAAAQEAAIALVEAQRAEADRMFASVKSSYMSLSAQIERVYEQAYNAAVESGHGQVQATLAATEAAVEARTKELAIAREAYAEEYAFEAALAAVRAGNAEVAVQVAQAAYQQATIAFDSGIAAIEAAKAAVESARSGANDASDTMVQHAAMAGAEVANTAAVQTSALIATQAAEVTTTTTTMSNQLAATAEQITTTMATMAQDAAGSVTTTLATAAESVAASWASYGSQLVSTFSTHMEQLEERARAAAARIADELAGHTLGGGFRGSVGDAAASLAQQASEHHAAWQQQRISEQQQSVTVQPVLLVDDIVDTVVQRLPARVRDMGVRL